jgi:hypothetical protein
VGRGGSQTDHGRGVADSQDDSQVGGLPGTVADDSGILTLRFELGRTLMDGGGRLARAVKPPRKLRGWAPSPAHLGGDQLVAGAH